MQDDTDMDEDFRFLEPLDLITKNVSELQQMIKEKKEKVQKDKANADNELDHEREPARDREKEKNGNAGGNTFPLQLICYLYEHCEH